MLPRCLSLTESFSCQSCTLVGAIMARRLVQISVFGLLLTLAATLPNKDDWDIYTFHINSTVSNRYATTIITSRVANRMDESKEIEFSVRIPKNAFISKFKMMIDGQEYDGVVKAKQEAVEQYTEAVSRGQSAGIVSSVGRTLEEFKTSVTVAAHKKVTFELTYEELLIRKLGKYELQIHARPMQPVSDFKVDVYINEKAGINFVELQGGLSSDANAITKTLTGTQAWVYYYPTVDQQKTCASCGEQGVNGDLVVVYDVNRDKSVGDIKHSAGYFLHHFAPTNLPRLPKNTVFIIDRSGSMHGNKIRQTRSALLRILSDLAEDDFFGLITFDGSISHWKRELVQATPANVESAKRFAQNIHERGATNINDAVLAGAHMLNVQPREGSASILILLTDGDPTTGVTNPSDIQSNVLEAIANKFPLYCLGFGYDVHFEFLEKMSLQNNGVARRIYEDSDADLQLKGFYEEVATPLLTGVTMTYNGGTNLTQTNFSHYYNGSEIVVAGQIVDNNIETFKPEVVAISSRSRMVFSDNATVESTSHIERVWAYLLVKQLLDKEVQLSGAEKQTAKEEALRLSLKFNFVTPLTSMVVTKPQGEDTDVLHKPKEGKPPVLDQINARGSLHMQRSPLMKGARMMPSGPAGPPVPPMTAIKRQGAKSARVGKITSTISILADNRRHHPAAPFDGGADRPHRTRFRATSNPVWHPMSGQVHLSPLLIPEQYDYDSEADLAPVRNVPPMPTHAPVLHRFLLSEGQPLPLCFEIIGSLLLKLFHHPNGELYVNGELSSTTNRGFKKIVFHLSGDQHVELYQKEFSVRDGQTVTRYTDQDMVRVGSLTVIKRDKDFDVAIGDTRIVVLIHDSAAEEFLWPVLRQRPLDTNITGILAVKPVTYEEVPQTQGTAKLRINNQQIDVTRSTILDYSNASGVMRDCWLMPVESALQGSVDSFIVPQL